MGQNLCGQCPHLGDRNWVFARNVGGGDLQLDDAGASLHDQFRSEEGMRDPDCPIAEPRDPRSIRPTRMVELCRVPPPSARTVLLEAEHKGEPPRCFRERNEGFAARRPGTLAGCMRQLGRRDGHCLMQDGRNGLLAQVAAGLRGETVGVGRRRQEERRQRCQGGCAECLHVAMLARSRPATVPPWRRRDAGATRRSYGGVRGTI